VQARRGAKGEVRASTHPTGGGASGYVPFRINAEPREFPVNGPGARRYPQRAGSLTQRPLPQA